jgi:stearoyl-CoA desaturase (delta-9 desaturase)
MYAADETKGSRVSIPYMPKPLDLPISTVENLSPPLQSKMTSIEEEEDFINNNYVARTLLNEPELPPITWSNWYREINWPKLIVLGSEPFIALYGICTTTSMWQTTVFALLYGILTGLGITAGYHRLFAHRSYEACLSLRYVLVTLAAGALQGSAQWWSRGHRAHHRYTDTDLDPYSAHKGLFHSHMGWLLFEPRRPPGVVDTTDLAHDESVQWQSRNLLALNIIMGFVVPTLVCGLGWGDYRGGYFFASVLRLLIVHHSTFCVNSLAHHFGDTPFDDKHSPRDHFITALITLGEGYHNFHHEFPSDYRNALRWYQYDPTKWAIWIFKKLGLATNLKKFPENEIRKGRYTMTRKALDKFGETIVWPKDRTQLPVISFEVYQELANQDVGRHLVLIAGFVHDVSNFIGSHPGGRTLLLNQVGKDATVPFHGGVKDHSIAAHNMLAMMRVAICEHGGEVEHLKKRLGHASTPTPISA